MGGWKKEWNFSQKSSFSLYSQAAFALFYTLVKGQQNSPNILPLYFPQRNIFKIE